MIGIDTTFVSDVLKGTVVPQELEFEELVICDIVYFECLAGSNKPKHVESFISEFDKVHLTIAIAKRAAEIFNHLRKQGREIGQADCLIAATYLENGITKILTRNTKHFSQIPGLEIVAY